MHFTRLFLFQMQNEFAIGDGNILRLLGAVHFVVRAVVPFVEIEFGAVEFIRPRELVIGHVKKNSMVCRLKKYLKLADP